MQKSSSDNGPKMARNVFNCCGVRNFVKHCSQVKFPDTTGAADAALAPSCVHVALLPG